MELNNISFRYKNKPNDFIFHNANLKLSKGFYVITGPNGCGKTTFVRILANTYSLYDGLLDGKVKVNGKPVVVLQDLDMQIFCETVLEEVDYFILNKNFKFKTADDFLNYWNISSFKNKKTSELSYGEKQIYIISVALSFNNTSDVIVMDEPFAFLDDKNFLALKNILLELKKNYTIIMLGHRFDEIRDIVDRFFLIEDKSFKETEVKNKNELMFEFTSSLEKILDVSISHKFISGKIDFTLKKGEVKFLYGKNGSGKSTIAKILCGLIDDYSGRVLYNGKKLDRKFLKRNIFTVMSNPDNQILTRKISDMFSNFEKNEVLSWVSEIRLLDKFNNYVFHLSWGEKQKFLMLYSFFLNKKIIIIDEPFLSFDLQSEIEIFKMIDDFLKKGLSIIITTHRKDIFNFVKCDIINI